MNRVARSDHLAPVKSVTVLLLLFTSLSLHLWLHIQHSIKYKQIRLRRKNNSWCFKGDGILRLDAFFLFLLCEYDKSPTASCWQWDQAWQLVTPVRLRCKELQIESVIGGDEVEHHLVMGGQVWTAVLMELNRSVTLGERCKSRKSGAFTTKLLGENWVYAGMEHREHLPYSQKGSKPSALGSHLCHQLEDSSGLCAWLLKHGVCAVLVDSPGFTLRSCTVIFTQIAGRVFTLHKRVI